MSNLELPSRSIAVVVIEASICVALNITGFIGNSLVCIAAYKHLNLRSNLYIIALAVSDLLVATIEMPLTSSTLIVGKWDFGNALCQIQGFVAEFTYYVTPATLSLIAFNRYVIRFFHPEDLRYGWVACGFSLHFTCWLSESQIGSQLIAFKALHCAPFPIQLMKFKSFIIVSLSDCFLFSRCA